MTQDRNLILASRVEHTSVFDEDGWLVGHVRDLSIDRVTGEVIYVIVSFGGFLGIGARLHPLPWSLLAYDTEKQGYVVPVEGKSLRDAPHFDAEELEDFGGAHHSKSRTHIFDYYGAFGPPTI